MADGDGFISQVPSCGSPALALCFSQTRLLVPHVAWGLEVAWNCTRYIGIALWCNVFSSSHELLEKKKSHQKKAEQA